MNYLQFMFLTSTYVEKAPPALLKVGHRPQRRPSSLHLWELLSVRFSDIETGE